MQVPGAGAVTDVHPRRTHVIEIDRAGPGVFQITDELRKDPCLIWVADRLIRLLD
jgi:hypothetical protein